MAAGRRRGIALGALCLGALLSTALVVMYPDSYQQDGGTHYLFARWAWTYPQNLVDVWGRPLFTTLYAPPALLGYRAAKLATVVIVVLTAWQTWRFAEDEGMERAALVIPFLWLQPSLLLVSSETMTEPLFALCLILALRLYRRGKVGPATLLVSATSLVRPEGFFICGLWAMWMMVDLRAGSVWWRRLWTVALLAVFPVAWWFAAFVITGDSLFIRHNWPANWSATGATYGKGLFLDYFYRRAEIVGPLLLYPFAVGVIATAWRRRLSLAVSILVVFFGVHSLLRLTGAFGSAGYPRYFVCVAPVIALLTLAGWNVLAGWVQAIARGLARPIIGVATAVVLAVSVLCAVAYVDDMPWSRDARLVDRAHDWFDAHPRPVQRLVYSQAYMCIRFRCDPNKRQLVQSPAAAVLAGLRAMPPGTLVIWDADTGPAFFDGVVADSIVAAGFTPLWVDADTLRGQLLPHLENGRLIPRVASWGWEGGSPRAQRMWLLYR